MAKKDSEDLPGDNSWKLLMSVFLLVIVGGAGGLFFQASIPLLSTIFFVVGVMLPAIAIGDSAIALCIALACS